MFNKTQSVDSIPGSKNKYMSRINIFLTNRLLIVNATTINFIVRH